MLKQDRKHRVHEYLTPQILWNSSLLIMLFFFLILGVVKNAGPGLFNTNGMPVVNYPHRC